jgi:hypothetical protein
VVVSNFQAVSQHSSGGIEENNETCSQGKLTTGNWLLQQTTIIEQVKKLPAFIRIIRETVTGHCHRQFQPSHIITICFSKCMEQSPPFEANSPLASQEILRLLWYPEIEYRDHKSSSLVPTFIQMHSLTHYLGIQ